MERARPFASLAAALAALAATGAPCFAADAPGSPTATPPREFENVLLGALLDFGWGSSAAGDTLLGDLGVASSGIRSVRSRSWLVQWDALLAARGGLLGNTHPFTPLVGARTSADGEIGNRWLPARRLSPYAGVRARGELTLMAPIGHPLSQLDQLNNFDGVGGVSASGALRVDAGVSFLDGNVSLLAVAFFEEALRAPGVYTPGASFGEGGVAARLDVSRRLTAAVELAGGASPVRAQAGLATADQTTTISVSGLVRVIFSTGIWIQVASGWSREMDRRGYAGSALVFSTESAPDFQATAALGVSLDRARWRSGAAR